jgi:hypothetical protein
MIPNDDNGDMDDLIWPRREPEIRRANGRRYVANMNRLMRKPHDGPNRTVFMVLEAVRAAFVAHGINPDSVSSNWGDVVTAGTRRFVWIFDEAATADECVKIHDTEVVTDPDWSG